MTVPGKGMLWVGYLKSTMSFYPLAFHPEKSYSNSSENQVSCGKLISRVRDPDVWKPLVIVNLMFFLQIWNGIVLDPSFQHNNLNIIK